jgi:hypothetical protein
VFASQKRKFINMFFEISSKNPDLSINIQYTSPLDPDEQIDYMFEQWGFEEDEEPEPASVETKTQDDGEELPW